MKINEKKFPRYTREENLSCKLTDKQIKAIPERRRHGETYKKIALDYGVSLQAIVYWCMSEEERKRKNALPKKKKYSFDHRFYRERKLALHPELKEYELVSRYRYETEKPAQFKKTKKKAEKNYWLKHKKKLTEKSKKYQMANLDKFRQYNKKSRENNLERYKKLHHESYLRHREKRIAYSRKKYREKRPIEIQKSIF